MAKSVKRLLLKMETTIYNVKTILVLTVMLLFFVGQSSAGNTYKGCYHCCYPKCRSRVEGGRSAKIACTMECFFDCIALPTPSCGGSSMLGPLARTLTKVEAYDEDKGCQGNFREFGTKCTDYIARDGPKRDPSQECCALIRGADIACMCAHIDPDVEEAISGEKVAYVVKFCGKALPSGSKCGSSQVGVE